MIKFIETERLILSPLSLKDISGDYSSWINDPAADMNTQHAIFPNSEISLTEYYKSRSVAGNSIWLGIFIKENESHIGNIDISSINWINRTGIYNILIGKLDAQNKGYGFEASIALLGHVFNRMNLNRIQLGVEEENKGAIKLYEKLGFKQEGILRNSIFKNGYYINSLVMAILKDDFLKK